MSVYVHISVSVEYCETLISILHTVGDDKCSSISNGVVVQNAGLGAYETRIIKGFN